MADDENRSSGLGSSVHRLFDTFLNTIRNRIELFSVEVGEETSWILTVFCWTAICIFVSFTAAIVLTITVVFLAPDQARPAVLIGFCLLYLLAALVAVLTLRSKIKSRNAPFSDTVKELQKDIAWLRTRE